MYHRDLGRAGGVEQPGDVRNRLAAGFFGQHRESGLRADHTALAFLGHECGGLWIEQVVKAGSRHENTRYRVREHVSRGVHMTLWELEIRESVRQTLADYTAATDRFDLRALASCFGPNGVLEFTGGVEPLTGPAAIEAGLLAAMTRQPDRQGDGAHTRPPPRFQHPVLLGGPGPRRGQQLFRRPHRRRARPLGPLPRRTDPRGRPMAVRAPPDQRGCILSR